MTYKTKDLGFYDECSIIDLLRSASKNRAVFVEVRDSEWETKTFCVNDEDSIVELLGGADTDWAFRFENKNGEYLGTFYVVLGNDDGSAVYDSSCQSWCDCVWKALD